MVSLSHAINDLYVNTVAPLLPLLVDKLGLSLTMAGGLGSVLTIVSVLQPFYGYVSDRWAGRTFLFVGPVMAAVGIGAMGVAPNYILLVLLVILTGTGSALYHPTGAATANVVSGDRKGLGMSIFMAAGALGRGAGPLVIVFVVTTFGLAKTWLIIAPAVVLMLAHRFLPPAKPSAADLDLATAGRVFAQQSRSLLLLWGIVAIRSAVSMGFVTFLPLLLTSRGASLQLAGSAVSVYLFAGAFGMILGGYLSDRFGARRTIAGSVSVAAPMFYVMLHTTGLTSLAAITIAGFSLMASHPITMVMGQELVPRHASTVSGFMMGFAFAFSGLIVGTVGWMADQVGLARTLNMLVAILLPSAPLVFALPRAPHRSRPAETESAPVSAGSRSNDFSRSTRHND